jgi:hypothetical protein
MIYELNVLSYSQVLLINLKSQGKRKDDYFFRSDIINKINMLIIRYMYT